MVELFKLEKDQEIYGVWQDSNPKSQAKDIPALARKYYQAANQQPGQVLPFYVLSQGYDPQTGDFALFIGGRIQNDNLAPVVLPTGLYAKIIVKPKLGFLWGKAIGEAKRYFYSQWLPITDYVALNMEYEYHTELSRGQNPCLEMIFAIKEV